MKNELVELYYSVNDFSDQNKVIFRLYDTEQLEEDYIKNGRKCSLELMNNDIYLTIHGKRYVLRNIEEKYVQAYLERNMRYGFSFLDQYHAVINGFYM